MPWCVPGGRNLSKAGFDENFKNYCLARMSHVYEAFRQESENYFNWTAA